MAYLDNTGLAYFWGKIKAWANSVFALIGHKHPSSDVNAMTGYSMPSSTGAISSGDTLNQAVGKLERAVVNGDISNVVHRTGNEIVQGVKTFKNAHAWTTGGNAALSSIQIQSTELERNAAPIGYSRFAGVVILDKNATSDLDFVNRLGSLEFQKDVDSDSKIVLKTYNPDTVNNETSYFSVGWLNSIPYATAPSTSSSRTNGNDILTRDWIPKDARIVHTTGNETVNGQKVFIENVHRKTTLFSRGTAPSGTIHVIPFNLIDSSDNDVAGLYYRYYTNKSCKWSLFLRKSIDASDNWDELGIGYSDDGTIYTFTPTPALNSNSLNIVNTAWIRTATGNTSLNAATATKLANARTIRTNLASTSTASFDGSANVTPGVTGTLPVANGGTGLTSLDTFVRTTGDQTVGGKKTFTSILFVERLNPYVQLKATDTARDGTAQSSSYAGFSVFDKNDKDIGGLYTICGDTAKRTTLKLRLYENKSADSARDIMFQWNVDGSNWFIPGTDNVIYLGGGSNRWKTVYAATGSINTSDERMKRSIGSVPDGVLDAWLDLDFLQFQFADAVDEKGDGARLHTGMVAQRVAAAFAAHGLDASRYGLFCHDSWEAEAASYSKDGKLIDPAREAGDRYSLRYEEALCMEAACMRRENARLKKRVADLEERLAALELRLGSE